MSPAVALGKEPAAAERVTAREAVERQFEAAPPPPRPALSAAEAAAIMKKYHKRIGEMIEPRREIGGDRADR